MDLITNHIVTIVISSKLKKEATLQFLLLLEKEHLCGTITVD